LHQTLVPDHIYDVVIVGGGVAGTALACSLGMCYVYGPAGDFYKHVLIFCIAASKPEFHAKKIALVEAFDLAPVKDWSPLENAFSNRVVSLTPASVSLLKGENSL
jgi:ubiquinone biosynthesis monooxygenase Coq6